MSELPARYCEICGVIHRPPIHNLATCHPCKYPSERIRWTPIDLETWPTKEEFAAEKAHWDAVLADKGTKPLS